MPDGSTPIVPKKSATPAKHDEQQRLTADQFDELSLGVSRALALSDVMAMMAMEGDAESLHKESLSTSLSMLCEMLVDVRAIIDASIDAGIARRVAAKAVAAAA